MTTDFYIVPRHTITKPILEAKGRETKNYVFIIDEIGVEHQYKKDAYDFKIFQSPEDVKHEVLRRLNYFKRAGESRRHWKDGKWGRQADRMKKYISNFKNWYKDNYDISRPNNQD